MVLCDWRSQITPPRPLRVVRAFGILRDCAVAPHFNRPAVRQWALAASRARPYLTILGLDECTAVLGRDGQFTVHGDGAVTVIRAGSAVRHEAGSRISLVRDTTRAVTERLPRGVAAGDGEPNNPIPAQ
jgi:cyanophycinase-like exopeptidase